MRRDDLSQAPQIQRKESESTREMIRFSADFIGAFNFGTLNFRLKSFWSHLLIKSSQAHAWSYRTKAVHRKRSENSTPGPACKLRFHDWPGCEDAIATCMHDAICFSTPPSHCKGRSFKQRFARLWNDFSSSGAGVLLTMYMYMLKNTSIIRWKHNRLYQTYLPESCI